MRNGKQNMIYGVRLGAKLTSRWTKRIGIVCLVLGAAIASPAQEGPASPDVVRFKLLFSFDGANGANPGGSGQPTVQGTDGDLYGATPAGGAYGSVSAYTGGTIFKITPTGSLTTLYNFCALPNCDDGSNPITPVLGMTAARQRPSCIL